MSNQATNQPSLFSNPVALICGFFCTVPGMLIGQIAGLSVALAYAPFISLLGGFITGSFGYWLTNDTAATPRNFFRYVAIAMATVIGALWGGMILSPVLFFNAAFLSTNVALILAITFGITIVAGTTYLILQFFRNDNSSAISAFALMLIGMTLLGCIGLMLGPQIWAVLLNVGILAGAGISILNNIFNKNTEASKILSSMFSMSGVLIGVMLGALVSVYVPFISSAMVSIFFGAALMLAGALLGHSIGSNYPEFNLNDPALRHKLYQAAFLLPVIFLGYLSGGIVGFLYLPLSEILLSQAMGMVVSSGLYGLVLTAYYVFRNLIYSSAPDEQLEKAKDEFTGTDYLISDSPLISVSPTPGSAVSSTAGVKEILARLSPANISNIDNMMDGVDSAVLAAKPAP